MPEACQPQFKIHINRDGILLTLYDHDTKNSRDEPYVDEVLMGKKIILGLNLRIRWRRHRMLRRHRKLKNIYPMG